MLAIIAMNDLTSICVGHESWHGASAHLRQRAASLSAACSESFVCFASAKLLARPAPLRSGLRFQCLRAACVSVVGLTRADVCGRGAAREEKRERRERRAAAARAQLLVRCGPVGPLLRRLGVSRLHVLTLDVEGAEAIVLETVDPAAFKVILVELDGVDEAKDARVHQMLTRAGMTRLPGTALLGKKDKSAVFMRSGTAAHPPLHLRRRGRRCVSMQPPGLRTSLYIDVC